MRVIVIGGGIGGLTAAIALHRVGIDVQVYERAPALREVGAGMGLIVNALQAFDLLGLGDEILSHSVAGAQGELKRWNGTVLTAIPSGNSEAAGSDGVMRTFAVMHRAELLAVLVQRIDPERLHLGRACIGFEQSTEGVTAHFDDDEAVHADALIGADGLNSVIRAQLPFHRPVRYSGYTCWRAVVGFPIGGVPAAGETWGRGRRFGILPMSRGRVYWFATNNAPEGQRDPPGRTRQVLANLFRDWHEPIVALIEASGEESILRNDICDTDPLPNFVSGRVGLLGDAAHAMTPNMGQGACQAIEDGVVLAACLRKNLTVHSGLLEYERRRVPRTSGFVLRSRRIGVIAQCDHPALCWMRDTAARATPGWIAARQMNSVLHAGLLAPAERAFFSGLLEFAR